MKNPEITPEEIKITLEDPDLMTTQCDEHLFYVRNIDNKGRLLVYCLKESKSNYLVQCADWLVEN